MRNFALDRLKLPKLNVDIQNEEFEIALSDYVLSRQEIKDTFTKIFSALGLIGLASSLSTFNALNVNSPASLVFAWVIPAVIHLVSFIIIWLVYQEMVLETHLRKLTDYFNKMFENHEYHNMISYKYDNYGPFATALSFRRGYAPYRVMVIISSVIAVIAQVLVIFGGYLLLHRDHVLMSTVYLLVNMFIGLVILIFWLDLQLNFTRYMTRIVKGYTGASVHDPDPDLLKPPAKRKLLYKLVPRPTDLSNKGLMFILGFLVCWAFYSEYIESRRGLVSEILGTGRFGAIPGTPLSSQVLPVLIIGLIFFVISELLVQQAKLLWDDIRDYKLDKARLQMNRRRALSSGNMTIPEAYVQMIVRWSLGLFLALLIDFDFFIILSAVTLLQIVYEFVAKPISGRIPLLWLLIVSIGLPLRFLSGAIAVNANLFRFEIIAYTILVFYLSVGNLSCWIFVECQEKATSDRPQAAFFNKHGASLQRWGLSSSLACGILLALYINQGPSLGIAEMPQVIQTMPWLFNVSDVWQYAATILALVVVTGILGLIIYFPIDVLLRVLIPRASPVVRIGRRKEAMMMLATIAMIVDIVIFFVGDRLVASAMFAVTLPLYLLLFYEAINYKEYSFSYLVENIQPLMKAWGWYLTDTTCPLRFKYLLMMTLGINSDLTEAKENYAKEWSLPRQPS